MTSEDASMVADPTTSAADLIAAIAPHVGRRVARRVPPRLRYARGLTAADLAQEAAVAMLEHAAAWSPDRNMTLRSWLEMKGQYAARHIRRVATGLRRAETYVQSSHGRPARVVPWPGAKGTEAAAGQWSPMQFAGRGADHADPAERAAVADAVAHALGLLSDRQRLAVVLVDRDGLTKREAADRIGCPVSTLIHLRRRAYEAFAAAFGTIRARPAPASHAEQLDRERRRQAACREERRRQREGRA